jgi:flavin-dependent dehydrogenase
VLVVGGGPAGATAARELAIAGWRVRLIDRANFPRNKPCGGGISMRVVPRFPYLADALREIATHYLSRLYLEGPDGQSTVVTSDGPAALMIRRVEFDTLLVRLAEQAGAEFVPHVDIVQARQDGEQVTLTARDGRVFEAPIVIAADGVHSIVTRRLGINPGWPADAVALDMMEETPREQLRDVDPSTLWVAYGYQPTRLNAEHAERAENRSFLDLSHAKQKDVSALSHANHAKNKHFSADSANSAFQRPAEGYAYIFPKRDHVNIGIGYVLSHYRERVAKSPYELQREFVATLRARGIVEGDSVRNNFTPFIIPVGGPLPEPARGRVLVAGDAGGFVNAFTAEGIYYAMVTGQLAARAIVQSGGDTDRLARRYRRLVDHEIGVELRDSTLIQRYLFADRRRIAQVIDGARREPRITRLILDLAMGRRPYRSVRRRILAGAPGLAWRFLWEVVGKRR